MFQEQAGQQGARFLPTAEVSEGQCPIGFGKTQAGQHLLDTDFVVVAAGQLKFFLQLAVFFEEFVTEFAIGHFGFHLAQAGGVILQPSEDGEHFIVYVVGMAVCDLTDTAVKRLL
ncbi:MAG: hypothetical protein P8183_12410 [Anaerolineae bacterium]